MADGVFKLKTMFDTTEAEKGINSLTTSLKKLGQLVGTIFAVRQLIQFGKQSVEIASSLAEVDNVVQKSFGDMRGEMDALANTAIETLGMSRLTAYKTGSTFMSMGKSMLDSSEDAKTMALELTKLTGNMASFYNVSQDVASVALKSIYTGETETLKNYGVVMSEVNLKEFAMAQGIKKSYSEMSQSEKVMLRYNYVTQQLNFIGNDFIDTQDSWSNQTRILTENWKEFMTVVGSSLITVLTPAIKLLNTLVTALTSVAKSFNSILSGVFGIEIQSLGSAVTSTTNATEAMLGYADSIEATGEAQKKANKSMSGFDKLNNSSSNSSSGTSGSGGSVGGISVSAGETGLTETNDSVPKWLEKVKSLLKPVSESFDKLKDSLSKLGSITWSSLSWIFDELLVPLGKWTVSEVVPAFIDILAEAINILSEVLEDIMPFIQFLWDEFLEPIATWTGGIIVDVLNGIGDALSWISQNEFAMTLLESLAGALIILTSAIGIYNGVVTIATAVTGAFSAVIGFLTSPIGIAVVALTALIAIGKLVIDNWDLIKEKCSKVWEAIKKTIKTVVDAIVGFFKTAWSNIKNVFAPVQQFFSNVWSTIKNCFSGVANWFKTIFTNAWQGVKNVFSTGGKIFNGITEGIVTFFKTIVNGIIDGINKVIAIPFNAINKILKKIHDVNILGVKPFTFVHEFEVPQIPRLATGAVIPANKPFMAMLGDQKNGTNIEAPLETIKQALRETLTGMGSNSSGDIVVQIDGKEVFRAVQKQSRIYSKSTGLNSFA